MQVAVIGLGAAGSYCARELTKRGCNVTAFEAKSHVGGRTQTVALAEGLYAEMGAEWIASDHHRVIKWLNSVNIRLIPTDQMPLGAWIGDELTFRATDWKDLKGCFKVTVKKCKSISKASRSTSFVDRVFHQCGLSERAIKFLEAYCHELFGFGPTQITIEDWIYAAEEEEMSADEFRTVEGIQEAIRRTLDGIQVNLGWLASRTDQGVVVSNGIETRLLTEFDAVVLAVPLPKAIELAGISDVDVFSGFAPATMVHGCKVVLGFDYSWWNDEGWNGILITDKFVGSLWPQQDRPVLCCYICSVNADYISGLPDPVSAALEVVAERFPAARSHFVSGLFYDWTDDNLIKGPFSYTRDSAAFRRLIKRIKDESGAYICGEYISDDYYGYVEGALDSATRVVQAITSKLKR